MNGIFLTNWNYFLIELASEAEAKKVLYSVYEIRRNESTPDNEEINKIEHCLSMIHFLAKEYEKVFYLNSIICCLKTIFSNSRNVQGGKLH